ncbi:carbohydrate ABC transporter permease [Kribbella voronezhensis]|uniref:carbohydrate ABC transporter permease n=1 Tax=Kribbella voronezhensis TaxID=2512212 RepID=UPI001416EF6D|nr:sugar ABC transporter permease [Kribbella voronezhensis]
MTRVRPVPQRRAATSARRRRGRQFWLFTSPWTIGFVLLGIVPLGYGLWMSFTDYSAVSPNWHYVGFDNYVRAISDPGVLKALARTAVVPFVVVPLTVGLGLVLAVLANQNIRGQAIFRIIFYLPVVVPPAAAALAFRMLFERDAGAVNGVLVSLGLSPVDWLSGGNALIVLLCLLVWIVGGNMVLSLAALQDVPTEVLEAARLDGAGASRRLVSVVIPIISPVLYYQVLMGFVAAVQIAVPALLLGGLGSGFPEGLDVIMVHILREFWSFGRIGYASALMWLLFLLLLVVSFVLVRVSRRFVHYTVDPEDQTS